MESWRALDDETSYRAMGNRKVKFCESVICGICATSTAIRVHEDDDASATSRHRVSMYTKELWRVCEGRISVEIIFTENCNRDLEKKLQARRRDGDRLSPEGNGDSLRRRSPPARRRGDSPQPPLRKQPGFPP